MWLIKKKKLEHRKQQRRKENDLGVAVRYLLPNNKIKASRIFVTGRSGTGKTTLSVKIIKKQLLKRVHRLFVICPSFYTQKTFSKITRFADEDDVFDRADDDIFEKIRSEIDKDLIENPDKMFLLFIDDVSSDYATNKGRKGAFASLSTEAPHINLSILALFQQAKSCSAAFRNNTDNIIMFAPADKDAIKCFQEEFNPFLYDKEKAKEYEKIAADIWDRGHFLFIHRPARHKVMSFEDFNKPIIL